MTARLEIDLDSERVRVDNAWLSREELAQRIQQMLASGDFKITRLSDALEQLAQAIGSTKTLTLKLSAEQYAKLESAGGRLGKPAAAFARDLIAQVIGTANASSPGMPAPVLTPPPMPAPVAAGPAVVSSSGLAATTSNVTPEEAAAALTIVPKKRGDTSPGIPAPVLAPTSGGAPTVVVDLSTAEAEAAKRPGAAPGDGRRWFNRS